LTKGETQIIHEHADTPLAFRSNPLSKSEPDSNSLLHWA
jgi:hypothetical protein